MTNAFSVLSLKRNRSTCNSKAHSFATIEPVSKLSKLKSGFSIFSKITQSLTQQQTQSQQQNDHSSFEKSKQRVGLFQYFRSDHDSRYRKGTFDSDKKFEYNQYYSIKKKENNKNLERNIHTLPAATTKKLTGILIKRSGTNPSTISFKQHQYQLIHRNRTYSNATSMTINSEDLTAREFADIAGIRILPEEEEEEDEDQIIESDGASNTRQRKLTINSSTTSDDEEEDIVMNTISSRYTIKSNNDYHERLSVLSYTSLQSYNNHNKLKIWDNEFWSHPERNITTSLTRTPKDGDEEKEENGPFSSSELDRKSSTKSSDLIEPPILHELRRMNTVNSNDCIIKKGRFEIHLGTSIDGDISTSASSNELIVEEIKQNPNTDSILSFSDDLGVLEWKRRKGKKP